MMKRMNTLILSLGVIVGPVMPPAYAQSASPGTTAPQNVSGQQPHHPDTGASAGIGGEASSSEQGKKFTSGASEDSNASNASDGYTTLPQPRTQGDITFLCGGVGREEEAYMKQVAADYDLMLTFAAKDGSYLADVNVELRDAGNNPVLRTECGGPMMLVDVPHSGDYSVLAETGGYALQHPVHVKKTKHPTAHSSLVLNWPTKVLNQPSQDTMSGSSGTSGMGKSGSEVHQRSQHEPSR